MTKGRLEAFTDGVIAIIITIMVLELHVPEGVELEDLGHLVPELCSYLLSFVFIGIYWNNHHHMLHLADRVDGRILWANMHLLFWLSLVPFATAWLGRSPTAPWPTAFYGVLMLASGVAWLILQRSIIANQGADGRLARAVGGDWKGKVSAIGYSSAIPLAFVHTGISDAIFVGLAGMWLIPDRRFERAAHADHRSTPG